MNNPFPIERHNLDRQGPCVRGHGLVGRKPSEGLVGVKRMRADPGHGAQGDDDEQRHRPDDHFELGRMVPARVIGRVLVGRAVTPPEDEREGDHRQDNEQHQRRRRDDEVALLDRNVASGIHHDQVAAAEEAGGHEKRQAPKGPAQWGPAPAPCGGRLSGKDGQGSHSMIPRRPGRRDAFVWNGKRRCPHGQTCRISERELARASMVVIAPDRR